MVSRRAVELPNEDRSTSVGVNTVEAQTCLASSNSVDLFMHELRRIARWWLLAGERQCPAIAAEIVRLWGSTHRVVRFDIHRAAPTLRYFASYELEKQEICFGIYAR